MNITRIDKTNEEFFLPLLHDQAKGGRPDLIRIGVTDDDQAVGALSAVIGQKDIVIQSVYVDPAFRRQGYGRTLVESLAALAGVSEVESITVYAKNDEETESFLRELGFELFEAVGTIRTRVCELMHSEKLRKQLLGRVSGDIRPLSSLSTDEKRRLRTYLSENRIYLSDLCDPEYSTVYKKKEKISSAVLAIPFPGGMEVTCTSDNDVDLREAFDHIAALIQSLIRDLEYDFTSEIRFISDDGVFADLFATLERNTGKIKSSNDVIHGVMLL